jgi:energy-converting hydrogenase Eha subunit B
MRKRNSLGHIRRFLFAALFVFCVSAAAAPAHAQLVQQYFPADIPGYSGNFGASVVNRMMMLNQTNGIEVGDFIIRPVVSENAGRLSPSAIS